MEMWSHGGTARYAAELAKGLAITGSANDIVELVVPTDFPYEGPEYVTRRILPPMSGAKLGGKLGRFLGLVLRRRAQVRATVERMRSGRPDIVHLLNPGLLASPLVRGADEGGIDLVVTLHDLPNDQGMRTWKTRLLARPYSRHLPKADLLVVHGEWSKERLQAVLQAESLSVSVLPIASFDYGPPTGSRGELRKKFGLDEDGYIALFFGSLRLEKGLDVLIEALADPRIDYLHLLVVGVSPSRSEPDVAYFRSRADFLGVASRITWIDRYVSDEEIPNIFDCVDVVVLPYRSSFAGQSGVLAVAAAYGVPVVVSAVGEMESTVRESGMGICVPPDSPEELAQAIARMRDVGRSATKGTWRTWTEMAVDLWKQYSKLVSKDKPNL